jgi:hypothetical protein
VNAPKLCYHVDEEVRCSDLSIFECKGKTVGASTRCDPDHEQNLSTLLYMYANIDEMAPYFR